MIAFARPGIGDQHAGCQGWLHLRLPYAKLLVYRECVFDCPIGCGCSGALDTLRVAPKRPSNSKAQIDAFARTCIESPASVASRAGNELRMRRSTPRRGAAWRDETKQRRPRGIAATGTAQRSLPSVFQTPHRNGTPTRSHAISTPRLKPPKPIPKEPVSVGVDVIFDLAAASSASPINHLDATGRINALAIKPTTRKLTRMYIV